MDIKKISTVKSNYQCKTETMSDIQYLLKIDFFVPYILIMVFPFPAPPVSCLPMAPPIQIYIFPLITNKQQRRKERKCAGKSWATRASCSALWIVSNKNLHWQLILLPPQPSIHQAFPVLLKLQSLMNTHFHFFCYICTHTNTQVQTYMCTEGHRHTQTHVFAHCHTHTECTEVHTCVHSSNNAYIQVLHMGTHTRIHTHEHTHIQSCIFAHVHTQGNSQASIHWLVMLWFLETAHGMFSDSAYAESYTGLVHIVSSQSYSKN